MLGQKYPWEGMTHGAGQALLGKDPPGVAAEKVARALMQRLPDREVPFQNVAHPLEALAWWLRSRERRLIQISPDAQDLLLQVSDERVRAGLSALRWNDIPNPGSPYYDRPLMLFFEGGTMGVHKQRLMPVFVFIQAIGSLFAEKLRYQAWFPSVEKADAGSDGQRRVVDVHLWLPFTGTRFEIERSWWESQDPVDIWKDENGKDLIMFWLAANTLAALNSEQTIPILRQRRSGQKRKATVGQVRGVTSFDLDLTGLFAWRKAYLNSPEIQRARGEYPNHRAPPVLHQVDEHKAIYWVREEHVHEGEQVHATKTTEKGTTLCAVFRKKAGYARGEGIVPTRERLRVGFDDLDTRKR